MEKQIYPSRRCGSELNVSKPYAYKLIRQLNEELKAKGFITIAGRKNRQYFYERLYGAGKGKCKCRYLRMKITVLGMMARYVNWKGERKQKCKRGFATKREAQEWERMFSCRTSSDLDMSFEAFTELYINDVKNRLKENTWLTKEHIIRTKILPYFGKLKISEISTRRLLLGRMKCFAYRDEKKSLIHRRI